MVYLLIIFVFLCKLYLECTQTAPTFPMKFWQKEKLGFVSMESVNHNEETKGLTHDKLKNEH